MLLTTQNPRNNNKVSEYQTLNAVELTNKINNSDVAFKSWRNVNVEKRAELLNNCATILEQRQEELSQLIAFEMGKTITEARNEILKCATTCLFYAKSAKGFTSDKIVESDSKESILKYEPLGVVLAIMPWNFPFWQFFRFAAPALILGNGILLKHASNVSGCSLAIEKVVLDSGFPKNLMTSLIIPSNDVNGVIANKIVKAVTLTGSEIAGKKVAECAGKYLKKCVLELGGSDPFIVLNDANLDKSVELGFSSRMLNGGQSCIAAKRFIIEEGIYDKYLIFFCKKVKEMEVYDPETNEGSIVPIAKESILLELIEIIDDAISKGAQLHCGGKRMDRLGNWLEPTVLSGVTKEMRAYSEELFGPVAVFYKVASSDEAIIQANDSKFGLGATIFSENIDKAKGMASRIQSGSVYINSMMKSDPRLPFGGIGLSGYGRELSREGMLEFANIKTVCLD